MKDRRAKTAKEMVKKISKVITVFLIGAFIGLLYESHISYQASQLQLLNKVNYQLPVELEQLGSQIGLTNAQLIAVHAQIGDNGNCLSGHDYGCYDPSTDSIRIPVAAFTTGNPAQSLAYEYMHHVWEKAIPDGTKQQLTPDIYTFYSSLYPNAAFRTEIDGLIAAEGPLHSPTITDELQSIACTTAADSDLSAPLLAYCSAHIPNRAVLPRDY